MDVDMLFCCLKNKMQYAKWGAAKKKERYRLTFTISCKTESAVFSVMAYLAILAKSGRKKLERWILWMGECKYVKTRPSRPTMGPWAMKRFFTSGLSYLYNIHHFPSISIVLVHSKKSGYRPTDGPTDGPTDRRTDTPSYRDGWTHLKKFQLITIGKK